MLALDVDAERLSEVCERYGVASLEVFGSGARGEVQSDSDVDLLYVLKPGARLGFRIFDLEDELAAVLGRPVDLVARKSINRYIREQVLADAQPLYAALGPAVAFHCPRGSRQPGLLGGADVAAGPAA